MCGNLWANSSAITYGFSGGRFGDNLISYLHAKYLSYQTGIPVLYNPFPYSDQLVFSDLEIQPPLHFMHHVHLAEGNEPNIEKGIESTLFCIDYFGERSWGRPNFPTFYVNWDDPSFREIIRAMVQPKKPLQYTVVPPRDRMSVALHARTGGGYEDFLTQEWDSWIVKFTRIPFYIRQLRYLYNFLEKQPLYVYIFTDDACPDLVMKQFQEALEECDIIFDCGPRGLRKDYQVLEDFFSMMQFDCSIHGDSHFSICAGLVKDYDVEIKPILFEFDYEAKKVLYEVMMRVHYDKTKQPTYQVIQRFSDG
jgi:hypothetical protein